MCWEKTESYKCLLKAEKAEKSGDFIKKRKEKERKEKSKCNEEKTDQTW